MLQLTIEIRNNEAMSELKELEKHNLIKFVKNKGNSLPSDRFKNIISKAKAKEMKKEINISREEWSAI